MLDNIGKIRSFLFSEKVGSFYERAKKLAYTKNIHHYNYIGINYENDEIEIKFYFTFFDKIEVSEVVAMGLLPWEDEYIQMIDFYTPNKENVHSWQDTGLTFSIKMSAAGKIRTGFHLRGRDFFKSQFYFPSKNIVLSELDLKNYQGIYYEYEDNKIFRKNYYYISDVTTKQQLAEMFQYNTILNAEIVEYTESELGDKVILLYNLTEKYLSLNVCSFVDEWLLNTVGLKEGFHGFYKYNGKKAKYYNAPFEMMNGIITFDTYTHLVSHLKENPQ